MATGNEEKSTKAELHDEARNGFQLVERKENALVLSPAINLSDTEKSSGPNFKRQKRNENNVLGQTLFVTVDEWNESSSFQLC